MHVCIHPLVRARYLPTSDQPSPTEAARTRGNGRVVQLLGVTCILHPTGRADLIVLSRVHHLLRLLHRRRRRYHGAPLSMNFHIQSWD